MSTRTKNPPVKITRVCLSLSLAILFAFANTVQSQQKASSSDVEKRVESLLNRLTLDEKITLLGGVNDFYTRPIPRLHIPSLRMSDGPVGVHDYGPTTAYPAGIALAASWDAELAKRVGISMGQDARARGVHFVLAPGLNIYLTSFLLTAANSRRSPCLGRMPILSLWEAVGAPRPRLSARSASWKALVMQRVKMCAPSIWRSPRRWTKLSVTPNLSIHRAALLV